MIESFYCPPSDPSEFVKLICTNPNNPTPVILRGTFRGATSREDTPGERIWGILISTSREEVDNAIAHPTILTDNLIAGLFLDPRTIVCDATTGEVYYNPREAISFWGGACPDVFDWLIEHQGWGLGI